MEVFGRICNSEIALWSGVFSKANLGNTPAYRTVLTKKEPTRRPLFLVRVESLVYTVGVIGPSHFAGAVGMRSRASRRRLSDNDIRYSASDRRWFPAHPAQHVHRRRNHGKGRIPSALASAHGRNGKRGVETSSAGRAGAHRPSEAVHPTRSSDVLPRIARERVPTVPHVAKTRLLRRRYANICETVQLGFFAEMEPIRPHSGSNPRLLCLTNFKISRSDK
jgi:hypothetical protein